MVLNGGSGPDIRRQITSHLGQSGHDQLGSLRQNQIPETQGLAHYVHGFTTKLRRDIRVPEFAHAGGEDFCRLQNLEGLLDDLIAIALNKAVPIPVTGDAPISFMAHVSVPVGHFLPVAPITSCAVG